MTEESFIMIKKGSPHEVEFVTDTDPHFTNVLMRKRKTSELVCSHFILTSDVPTWVSYHEADGFTIQEEQR